jgi:hypothetical protein
MEKLEYQLVHEGESLSEIRDNLETVTTEVEYQGRRYVSLAKFPRNKPGLIDSHKMATLRRIAHEAVEQNPMITHISVEIQQ